MCGIIGYTGERPAAPILLDGLRRLEYRGYDSAGLAVSSGAGFTCVREAGRVSALADKVAPSSLPATCGISHTRWATHGAVTEANAHPHLSSDGCIALVHNGVIENHLALREVLLAEKFSFVSETDTEVLANLIALLYRGLDEGNPVDRFTEAVRLALGRVQGTYGIAALCREAPGHIIGARLGSPLILGVGAGEHLLASDAAALVSSTRNVVYLKDREVVHLTPDRFSLSTISRQSVSAVVSKIAWSVEDTEKGDFSHFMEKEIFEQPAALENAMRGRFADDESSPKFGGLNLTPPELRRIDRLLFCGCGSAWHACLSARYLIERYARIPVDVEYASEFRYRNAPLAKDTLVFVLSQSGETIDTLAALREALAKGYRVLAIVNSVGSTIAREAEGGIYQHAGPEIGVASTKAFTSHLMLAAMLAVYLGRMRDLSFTEGCRLVAGLRRAPGLARQALDLAPAIRSVADRFTHFDDMLFLGRQQMFPLALEGALKLKEIAYIHAEGYPAAELKHGPIALVGPQCPCLFLAPNDEVLPKVLSNVQEVKARGAPVILISTADAPIPDGLADEHIILPACPEPVLPVIAAIPLQLLSYYIAVNRGCDVDKPRNLAKSVTVE
ncbi:MAG: glutamine--fructose-6-phosphate transaminase (isomerizing) [Puniceicoccaceae bacterium]|nr:MAG: glutamine--fructose-6-phosphate transaminase (isomerizing) [Puniceicoccaceae bacterium]